MMLRQAFSRLTSSLYLNIMGIACLCIAYPMVKCGDYYDRTSGSILTNIRYDLWKFTIDRIGSTILLIVLSPLLILISISIMVETPGGVLFLQDRYGHNSRIFSILKFRTMYAGSVDGLLASVGDQRITRVGRVLRSMSMDELPQLWNVIRGDMSLVGPRPHAPWATADGVPYCEADPRYFSRYQYVKPGITGLAQVMGFRGPTDTIAAITNRVRYDLEYIKRRSVWLDLKILFRTVGALSRNAV